MKTNKRITRGSGLIAAVLALILSYQAVLPILAADTDASDADAVYDTWVATDALGRTTPTYETAGGRREAYVGIFYFMFLDKRVNVRANFDIIDFTRAYEIGGAQGVWNAAVTDGFHIWAEPYFGYYMNTDEWVIRKHAYMLSEAGVDFIYLDVTNPTMFEHCWRELFRVWKEIREEGQKTPQIVFSFGCTMYPDNLKVIIEDIYTPDENGEYPYSDLWFMWEGKPLIMGNFADIDEATKDFFTIRYSWAYEDKKNGSWPWIQLYPQNPGLSDTGEEEQMAVAAGFHANSSHGRSLVTEVTGTGRRARAVYNQTVNGKLDFGYSLPETELGLAFEQQWSYAIEKKPQVVMLTGWNEFTFGKQVELGVGQTVASMYKVTVGDPVTQSNYIDAMTAEYSRDIEPIKSKFGDNYFYQMASNIRLFKGVNPIPESHSAFDVDMSGGLSEFDAPDTLYRDVTGDITHRDYPSVGNLFRYVNETGRNDLVSARISKTPEYVYFCIDCADTVIRDGGANWMNLFVNVDRAYETGWEGYDFIINRSRTDSTCSVERFYSSEWEEAVTVGTADYAINGNRMVIRVSSELLGLDTRDSFDFKWADNSTVTGNVREFLDLGDSAPNDRYRFRYIKANGQYPDELLPTAPETDAETVDGADPGTDADNETESGTKAGSVVDGESGTDAPAPNQPDAKDPPSGPDARVLWVILAVTDALLAVIFVSALIFRKRGGNATKGGDAA